MSIDVWKEEKTQNENMDDGRNVDADGVMSGALNDHTMDELIEN